jgi:hypothetical protein
VIRSSIDFIFSERKIFAGVFRDIVWIGIVGLVGFESHVSVSACFLAANMVRVVRIVDLRRRLPPRTGKRRGRIRSATTSISARWCLAAAKESTASSSTEAMAGKRRRQERHQRKAERRKQVRTLQHPGQLLSEWRSRQEEPPPAVTSAKAHA